MLRSAVSASLIYGLAGVLSKGIALLLLPIYTRIMAPQDFGAFDLIMTLAALANLTVALEVSQGLARHWSDAGPGDRLRLASTALWFTCGTGAAFLVAALLWSRELTALVIGDPAYLAAMRLGIAFIAVNGVLLLLQSQFRWEQRSRDYAIVSLVHAVLTLLLTAILCLGFGLGLAGAMASLLLSASIAAALAGVMLRRSFAPVFDLAWLRTMLGFSLPLVPAGIATFLNLYLNRLVLGHYGTLADVGLFAAASRIAGLVLLLIMGIQLALTPLVYEQHRDSQTPGQLARLTSAFLALALIVCLGLGLFAPEFLLVFATKEYQAASALLAVLAPALLLSQMYVFAPGIGIARRTWWQLWIVLCAAIASVVLNLALVPSMGAMGAAVATLAATSVFLGLWVFASQRLYPVPYPGGRYAAAVLLFALLLTTGLAVIETRSAMFDLLARAALLAAMACGCIALRLVAPADLRKLLAR